MLDTITGDTWRLLAQWGAFLLLLVVCVRLRPWRWLTPFLRGDRSG